MTETTTAAVEQRLRAALLDLVDEYAAAIAPDPAAPAAAREHLAALAVAEMTAEFGSSYARTFAHRAAGAGADFGDLAKAAGLASRQAARRRWPDLGATRATSAARDGRPLRPYVLRHDPDGWSLTAAGAAFRTTKDLPAADAAGAQEWATAQLRDAGVNVTGWASREDQAAGPGYLATVGRRVRR